MISIVYSKERDKIFDFSKEPVVTAWGQVYTRKDSNISSILDLEGKKVAVMAKDINGKHFVDLSSKFNVKSDFIRAEIYDDVCELILSKKVVAGVINNINGPFLQRRYNIHPTPIMFSPISASFAVPEGKNQDIIIAIDSLLSQWRKDKSSIYYDILNKWYGNIEKQYLIPYKLIAFIIFLGTGISLFLYFWMRLLKHQVKARTKELWESEEKFTKAFLSSPTLMAITRMADGRIVDVNESFTLTIGYSREEVIGSSTLEMGLWVKSAERDRFLKSIQEYDQVRNLEVQIRKKSGEIGWVLFSGELVNLFGEPHLITVAVDITERKQAEEALRESEEKYRNLVERANDGVIIAQDGIVKFVNTRMAEMFGYTVQEMANTHFLDYVFPDERSKIMDMYKRRVQGEDVPEIYEMIALHKDGSRIDLETNSGIIAYNGKPATLSFIRDITERKKTTKALQTEKEFTENALNAQTDTFFVFEPSTGKAIRWNKAFNEISGYSDKEIQSMQAPGSYYNKGDLEKAAAVIERVMQEGKGIVEISLITKYGQTIPTEYSVSAVKDEEGGPKHLIAIGRNISDRIKAEEEKKKLETQLQQAQKMEAIGTLAGGIAHDFNNILTPIIVQSELALMDIDDEDPVQHNLEEVLRAGLRAKDLVKQILTFSRQSEQQPISLKLTPIIKEAIRLLRASLPSTIEICLNIEEGSDTVTADPTQIHQVLMNLCTNAGHAMRESGGTLEVGMSYIEFDSDNTISQTDLDPGPYLKLKVSDTGNGISPDVMDRIFDPFFTTKERSEGTGMGLAVVHGIISSYGGAITVESELDKGTTFNVFLPMAKSNILEKTEDIRQIPTGSERILVVDDEIGMVRTLKRMLYRIGYEVVEKTSSLEALAAFQVEPDKFDLVISDQTMPKMTGDELAKKIMEIRSDIPIILCTGFSERINEEKAREIGIKAFVMKPIEMSEIANTIRQVIDNK